MENIKTSDEDKRMKFLDRLQMDTRAFATEFVCLCARGGLRKIEEIADVLTLLLGDSIRPYIRQVYVSLYFDPVIEKMGIDDDLTPFEEMENFDTYNYDNLLFDDDEYEDNEYEDNEPKSKDDDFSEANEEGKEDEENTCGKNNLFYVVDRENRRTIYLSQKEMGKVNRYAVENAIERKTREMAEQGEDVLAQVKETRIMRGMTGWGLPSHWELEEKDENGEPTMKAEMAWDDMLMQIEMTPEVIDAKKFVSAMTLTEENILDEESWEEMTLYDMIERMTPSEWD